MKKKPVIATPEYEEFASKPADAEEARAVRVSAGTGRGAVVKGASEAEPEASLHSVKPPKPEELPGVVKTEETEPEAAESITEGPKEDAPEEKESAPPLEAVEEPKPEEKTAESEEKASEPDAGTDERPEIQPEEKPPVQSMEVPTPPVPVVSLEPPKVLPPKPLSNETVTEHTAALWKYQPIPGDEPEPAPEYRKTREAYGSVQVTAARVRGKKHKHEGTNCDDWYEVSSLGGIVFAAVSDGAGSKKLSRIGARESCRGAVGCLRKSVADLLARKPGILEDVARAFSDPRCMPACGEFAGVVQRAVLKGRDAVETAWYTRLTDPAYEKLLGRMPELTDFAATLLVTAIVPAGSAGRLVVSCQVGDGMTALIDSRGSYESAVKLMGEADSGEFSGETDFLTSAKMGTLEALQNRTKLSLGHSDVLLMMTDGVADDYFPPQRELRRLYLDLVANGVLHSQPGALTPEVMRCYQTFPPPLAYPWVNDRSVQVPLHYTRRIAEAGQTMETLWANRTALSMAGMAVGSEDPAENLCRWLDNYVERGSFDDRTLLAIQM